MKKLGSLACAFILCVSCLVMFDSCKGKTAKTAEADIEEQESIFNVIDKYVAEEFGSQYSQGDHCIPSPLILEVDESDPGEISAFTITSSPGTLSRPFPEAATLDSFISRRSMANLK